MAQPPRETEALAPQLELLRSAPGMLAVQMSGTWRVGQPVPTTAPVRRELDAERPARIAFDARALAGWDSTLVAFAGGVLQLATAAGVEVDRRGLPEGVQHLLALAEATPRLPAHAAGPRSSWLARVGSKTIAIADVAGQVVAWIGELTIAFARLVTGRARFRTATMYVQMQLAGAQALWIVGVVAALVGLILAFIGAVQLQRFGATLYLADLVGIAMVREMGAMMAAIVVAGRTGAAFAAELGTMRVTQEIDALTTMGVSPVEFLVLPRVIALTLMLPLLCIYADLIGVAAGAVVGIGVVHVAPRVYLDQTIKAVAISDLLGGMVKAMTYGMLIGAAACFEGLRAGRTAAAVGKAATAAVVDGIVLVIAACGAYAFLFYLLGI